MTIVFNIQIFVNDEDELGPAYLKLFEAMTGDFPFGWESVSAETGTGEVFPDDVFEDTLDAVIKRRNE